MDELEEQVADCALCEKVLTASDVGLCEKCGKTFCWGECGGHYFSNHYCGNCVNEEEQ